MATGFQLGIDFGTSHTVAMLRWPDGRAKPLLFDGSPLLPSAVYLEPTGRFVVGRDAAHSARMDPGRYEPNPKRRIDDGSVLLGDREVATVDLVGAVLGMVAEEARRTAGAIPAAVTITYPAAWGPPRRRILAAAAAQAGFGKVRMVEEPVAAATYFGRVLGQQMPEGSAVVVYDFGGGTFDVSLVERTHDGLRTVVVEGRDDIGGLDLDEALVRRIGAIYGDGDATAWRRLGAPVTTQDRRQRRLFREDVRAVKERLSRHPSAELYLPGLERDVHVTRGEFEELARPLLMETVRLTRYAVERSGLPLDRIAGVFLVGGSSRIPLVATLVHQGLGIAPTVIEQPEMVVAEGSILVRDVVARVPVPAPVSPAPAPAPAPIRTRTVTVPTVVVPAVAIPPAPAPAPAPAAPTRVASPVNEARTAPPAEVLEAEPLAGTRRQRWVLVAGAALVVALLLVAAYTLWPQKTKGRHNGGAAGPSASAGSSSYPVPRACKLAAPGPQATPLAAGNAPTSAPFALPEGWRWHQDDSGYKIGVPYRLKAETTDTGTCFHDPDGSRFLSVGQWKQPDNDMVALLNRRDSKAATDLPGYRKIGINKKDYYDGGAEWEFTYTGTGGAMHAYVVAFVTPGQRGYAIGWCTFESDWQSNLSDYSRVVGAFQPAQ
jgi:actin-like ATPase involved in cell morphogenesis